MALVRPVIIAQDLGLGIGTGVRKRGFREMGLADRQQDPQAVGVRQRFIPFVLQARVFLQQPHDGVALLFYGGLPASSAKVWLILPFQEMSEQNLQPAFQLLLLAGAHIFQFLGQVPGIDLLPPTSTDQPGVLQGPGVEILFV